MGDVSSISSTSIFNDEIDPSLDPYHQLSLAENEIVEVSARLTSIQEKVQHLKEHINRLRSPIARLLPPEIMGEIFWWYLPSFNPFQDHAELGLPLEIGAVCSLWRRIAWEFPLLWSSITVKFADDAHRVQEQLILVEDWLKRSKDLPLSIRICSSESTVWTPKIPAAIITLLRQHVSRWRVIDLRIPSSCYPHLPSADESLPLLETFSIDPPGGQGDRINKINFGNTPKLTDISLSCVYLRSVTCQWEVLTRLALYSFYIDECLEIMKQSTLLEILEFRRILDGDDRHTPGDEPIPVGNLTTLKINNDKEIDCKLFFDMLVAPKLNEFSYNATNGVFPTSPFTSFISRSSCPLTSLIITDATLSGPDLLATLTSLPTLKHLQLTVPASDAPPLTDEVLCSLVFKPNPPPIIPVLETLSYRGPQTFTWGSFLSSILSRRPKEHIEPPFHQSTTYLTSLSLTLLYKTPTAPSQNETMAAIGQLSSTGLPCQFQQIFAESSRGTNTPNSVEAP